MCGITGIFAFNLVGKVHKINVTAATMALQKRGPDFQDIYLRATRRTGVPSHEEAKGIYSAFWSDSHGEPRRDSSLVYLNTYDHGGTFQFQVFWEPARHSLVFSLTEHY